jgi:hypothetical protein
MLPFTLQFLIAMIASAINERLQRKLDYALEESRCPMALLSAARGSEVS